MKVEDGYVIKAPKTQKALSSQTVERVPEMRNRAVESLAPCGAEVGRGHREVDGLREQGGMVTWRRLDTKEGARLWMALSVNSNILNYSLNLTGSS